MKTRNKALLLSLCAVMLVAASVFGTVAYLTSTDAVENTFTVGTVAITLDEADVKTDGSYETNAQNRTDANQYLLMPGHTYIKDPTVHVANGSQDCWLFVKVENGIADIEAAASSNYSPIASQIAANSWTALAGVENVYYKEYDMDAEPLVSDYVVFADFKIDGDKAVNVPAGETVPEGKYNIADYASAKITVTAYAVQKDGFGTADAAWEATFGN